MLTTAACSPQTPGPGAASPAPAEQASPSSPAEPEAAAAEPEQTFGPYDLYLFHNPGCHVCERIVALEPEFEKLHSDLVVIPENNTVAGANERALKLRSQSKVPAEAWGPSVAIFMGNGWDTETGLVLRQKIHAMLKDRVEVMPQEWAGTTMQPVAALRDRIQILAEFSARHPRDMRTIGLQYGLSFPLALAWFGLVGLLILAAGSARRALALGLGFWGGSVLMLGAFILLGEKSLRPVLSGPAVLGTKVGVYLLLALIGLLIARSRWGAYRTSLGAAEPTPAAEGAPSPRLGRRLVLGGLALGAVLAWIALVLRPPSDTLIITEVWALGDVPGLVLSYLAHFLLLAAAPALVITLVAAVFVASPAVRRRFSPGSSEGHFAAAVAFLIMALFLVSQAVTAALWHVPMG